MCKLFILSGSLLYNKIDTILVTYITHSISLGLSGAKIIEAQKRKLWHKAVRTVRGTVMVLLLCMLHMDNMSHDSQEKTQSGHQFMRGRSSYKQKIGSHINKQVLIIHLMLVETQELILMYQWITVVLPSSQFKLCCFV